MRIRGIAKKLLSKSPSLYASIHTKNFERNHKQDFTNIDQTTKDGHDWAARVMIGHGKKFGSKLLSLSHSSFLNEGFLQQSPWTKGRRTR